MTNLTNIDTGLSKLKQIAQKLSRSDDRMVVKINGVELTAAEIHALAAIEKTEDTETDKAGQY